MAVWKSTRAEEKSILGKISREGWDSSRSAGRPGALWAPWKCKCFLFAPICFQVLCRFYTQTPTYKYVLTIIIDFPREAWAIFASGLVRSIPPSLPWTIFISITVACLPPQSWRAYGWVARICQTWEWSPSWRWLPIASLQIIIFLFIVCHTCQTRDKVWHEMQEVLLDKKEAIKYKK